MSFVMKLVPDQISESPRHDDNVTQMWCAHGRYNLGDKDFPKRPATEAEIKKTYGPIALIKPLYMYDHGGLTIKTSPFSCPWDSGQIGWVWITREMARKEWGGPNKHFRTQKAWCEAALEGEVKTYDQYLRGDVWGYQIIEVETDEVVESSYGYYGDEDATSEGQATLAYVIAHEDKYETRKAA